MPNVDGGSLWELVERRAAATPDGLAAVDEDGRTLTWAEAKAARRAWPPPGWPAWGSAPATSCPGSSRPGSSRSSSCSPWPASARSRTRCCPIYREREVGFVTRQAKSEAARRAVDLERVRLRGHGPRHRRADRRRGRLDGRCSSPTRRCRRATRPPCPPPPDPAQDPVRWYFYTSGTTADPKGAQHTDRTILAGSVGMSERLGCSDQDINAVVFPFTHIGGIGWLVQRPRLRVPHRVHRALRPGEDRRA